MRHYSAYDDARDAWTRLGNFDDESAAWEAAIDAVGHDDVALYMSAAEW